MDAGTVDAGPPLVPHWHRHPHSTILTPQPRRPCVATGCRESPGEQAIRHRAGYTQPRRPHTAAAALLAPMCAQYRKGVHQAKRRPAELSLEPVAPPSLSQPHPYQAPARAWLNLRPSRARLTGRRRRSDRRPARSPAPRHQRLSCSRRQSSRRQRRLPRQNPSRRLRCCRVRERG